MQCKLMQLLKVPKLLKQAAIGQAIGQIGGMFGSVGWNGGGTTAPATTSFGGSVCT